MIKPYLESLNIFTDDALREALGFFTKKMVKKDEFLIREGEVCKALTFVESGAFHVYRTSDEEQVTIRFACKNRVVSAYSSFITGQKSKESIVCIKDSTVWLIEKKHIDGQSTNSLAWSRFMGIISDLHYLELEGFMLEKQQYSAAERYQKIVSDHPECVLETPLKHLAAYLGVTPRHLSRIRKAQSNF